MGRSISKINIYQKWEYRTTITDIYRIERDDFLYDQYLQAAKCIDEITMRWIEYNESGDSMEGFSGKGYPGYPNNVIAFCAKRGHGKTSAMLSVVKALVDLHQLKVHSKEKSLSSKVKEFWEEAHRLNIGDLVGAESTKNNGETSPVLNTRYTWLETIDPTTMGRTDSILETILARLFRKIKEEHEKKLYYPSNEYRADNSESKEYRVLLELVQEVEQHIRTTKHERHLDEYEIIEQLGEIDDNKFTRSKIISLIEKTLKYLGSDIMIIPIDDADNDPSRVYEVVEDIRKYFGIPGVLIMMAVHLETLTNCIEQKYILSYRYILQTGYSVSHLDANRCRKLAAQYIDKLIPDLHQIHLPYFDERIRDGAELELHYWDSADPKNDLLTCSNNAEEAVSYQDKLMALVYRKTGVILVGKKGTHHPFLPKRYRELTHMASFFTRMKDVENQDIGLQDIVRAQCSLLNNNDNKEDTKIKKALSQDAIENNIRTRISNINQLETYFFEHWMPLYLTKSTCMDFRLLRDTPLEQKNRRTMDMIGSFCPDALNGYNYHDCIISYADIIETLDEVLKYSTDRAKYEFVCSIKMYYTIFMNKIVCYKLAEARTDDEGTTRTNFFDLESLTQGLVTRLSEDLSVVSYIRKGTSQHVSDSPNEGTEGSSMQKIECDNMGRWLIPCNQEGHLDKYDASEWMEKKDKHWSMSVWYRMDPFRCLFYFLNTYPNNGNIRSRHIVVALQYICNCDLHDAAQRNILDPIIRINNRRKSENGKELQPHQVPMYIYGSYNNNDDSESAPWSLFEIMAGKKDCTKKLHSLNIAVTDFHVSNYNNTEGKDADDRSQPEITDGDVGGEKITYQAGNSIGTGDKNNNNENMKYPKFVKELKGGEYGDVKFAAVRRKKVRTKVRTPFEEYLGEDEAQRLLYAVSNGYKALDNLRYLERKTRSSRAKEKKAQE